jgi:hypothetical protein
VLRSIAECWDDLLNLGKSKDGAKALLWAETLTFPPVSPVGTPLVYVKA